jgi:hypothetical protein
MTRNRGAVKSLLIGLLFVVSTGVLLYTAIPAEERAALIALYNATNGDNWENNSGWKTPPLHTDGFAMPGTEEDWDGILISGDHVEYISMSSNSLEGSIPPEIGNLENLICLYLDYNELSGSIPSELGNLTKLSCLYLNDNQLTGSIPGELFDLNTILRLSSNKLTGELPLNLINFKGIMNIKYNGLYTNNPDIRIFLNQINKGWEDTQTIAPANVSALTVSISSIKISWNPILYQDDTGGYEIYFSTTSGGPWLYAGRTETKSASYYTVSGLNPGTKYFFRVRTITHSHTNNANEVISEYSNEVSATTDTMILSRVISVQSTPSKGATIKVMPIDNNGRGNGITQFTRTYYKGTTVTLTAPETYNGKNFLKWTVDGIDNIERILEITVYDNIEITAVYGQGNVDITVTTTEDNVPGSLREAITKANANNKDTTIILPAGVYYLYGADNEDNNQSGDLDIYPSQNITITGEGTETTVIDGSRLDRVLHIIKGSVSISGVTIQNGKTSDGQKYGEDGEDGGGIQNNGDLSLTNCLIDNNKCGKGYWGAVSLSGTVCPGRGGYGGGVYNSGSLTLIGCTVKNNSAGDCGGAIDLCSIPNSGRGGGIYNSSTGTQVLRNCMIRNNTSGSGYEGGWDHDVNNNGGDGGGIYNEGIQELIDCTINSNVTGIGGPGSYSGGDEGRSGHGGGIYNGGKSTIKNSIIKYNTTGDGDQYYIDGDSQGDGGAIYNSGTLNLTNSTVSNNSTGAGGSGGGIYHYLGILTLTNCSINNNTTGNGLERRNGGNGAGIFNGETLILTNCTVSGNNTGNGGDNNWASGGNGGSGGGIYNNNTMTVTNCTICNNETGEGGNGKNMTEDGNPGHGGGIYNFNDYEVVEVKNTIIANNQVPSGGEGPDYWGSLNSQGYNHIENTAHCTISGTLYGNITGIDPLLGPLSDNGGPTLTHILLPGSPAIDAGDSTGIPTDQRGYHRPVDIPGITNVSDGSDIGAYEYDSPNLAYYTISGKITYNGLGFAGVTLTFSNNGGTTTTTESGYYSQQVLSGWSGIVTPSKNGYIFSPSFREYTSLASNQTGQDYTAATTVPSEISLSRTQLNFGASRSGNHTNFQTFLIRNSGNGILNWTLSNNAEWLSCSPETGSGDGEVSVFVDATGLSEGTYTGSITISDPDASNSPQTVNVTLQVYNSTTSPFGSFDTPIQGSTVMSSVPFTGWVLDDIETQSVQLFRENGNSMVYIGDALFVEGARPDVELAYPGYPNNHKAGWGYMMLTNFLPNGGNGTFNIHAIATDQEVNQVTLGTKTIICDNANAVKPFGAIDTPAQGGTAFGSDYINFGWALTPLPNTIPIDGSTIQVWVDGVPIGNPVYNQYRKDIATLFPDYNNSNGAVGYFYLDTTKYENGVHTIAWSAEDDAGNKDGIGSRYFTIQNLGGSSNHTAYSYSAEHSDNLARLNDLLKMPIDYSEPIGVIKGFNRNGVPLKSYPDANGNITIEIRELERIEVRLFPVGAAGQAPLSICTGYQVVGSQLRPLPIGATLDSEIGVFYWLPGPAFIGEYRFIFIKKGPNGEMSRVNINVWIEPKFMEDDAVN